MIIRNLRSSCLALATSVFLLLAIAAHTRAQPVGCIVSEEQRLVVSSDEVYPDQPWLGLGASLDGDGPIAAAGFPATSTTFRPQLGKCVIYERVDGSWILFRELPYPEVTMIDNFVRFGAAVAVAGQRLVVGTEDRDSLSGFGGYLGVYVYERGNGPNFWGSPPTLIPHPCQECDEIFVPWNFGRTLDLEGDRLVVGAPGYGLESTPSTIRGAVYAFKFDGESWVDDASDPVVNPIQDTNQITIENHTRFGYEVTFDADFLAIGAPAEDLPFSEIGPFDIGAVYIYQRVEQPGGVEYQLRQRLVSPAPAADNFFGNAVDIRELSATKVRVLVGERGADGAHGGAGGGFRSGRAHVFEGDLTQPPGSQWTLLQTFDDGGTFDIEGLLGPFGIDVKFDGDRLIIGRPRRNLVPNPDGSGSGTTTPPPEPGEYADVFVYDLAPGFDDQWELALTLTASDVDDSNAAAGTTVAIAGTTILAGDPMDSAGTPLDEPPPGPDPVRGAVYTFEIASLADCDENGLFDVCEIAADPSLDINENGILDACEPDCNDNGIPDDVDIALGTSQDVNEDGVPDECQCFVDIVFAVDSSGSKQNQEDILVLAGELEATLDIDPPPHVTVYSLLPEAFEGFDGTVAEDLTDEVPCVNMGNPPCDGCNQYIGHEDWAGAAAIVAQHFPWRDGARRIVVAVSDEPPCQGSAGPPSADASAIQNAIEVCTANCVHAFVIVTAGDNHEEAVPYAQDLATGTAAKVYETFEEAPSDPQEWAALREQFVLDIKNIVCDCLGDLNGDRVVNSTDLNIVLTDFGCTAGPGNCPGDADGDGDTDSTDLNIVLTAFGTECGCDSGEGEGGGEAMIVLGGPGQPSTIDFVNVWASSLGYADWQAWVADLPQFNMPAQQFQVQQLQSFLAQVAGGGE